MFTTHGTLNDLTIDRLRGMTRGADAPVATVHVDRGGLASSSRSARACPQAVDGPRHVDRAAFRLPRS